MQLFDYCGARPANHCAPRITTSLRVSLATSIGRPVESSPLSKRARMMPAALVRWTRSISSWALTLYRFSTAKIHNPLYLPSNCPAFIEDRNRAFLKPNRQLEQRVGTKENRYLTKQTQIAESGSISLRRPRIGPLAAARTTITAIETKTAPPFNLRVKGKCAAGEPHAVTPLMLKHANTKLFLLGSQYRP